MNRLRREQQLIISTIAVLSERGYAQASVSHIIKKSRIARGTFYLYFKSKKHIVEVILKRFFDQIIANMAKIHRRQSPGMSTTHEYHQLAGDLITMLVRNKPLLKLILVENISFEDEIGKLIDTSYERMIQLVRAHLDTACETERSENYSANLLSRFLVGGIKEIIHHWLSHDDLALNGTTIDQIIHLVLQSTSSLPSHTLSLSANNVLPLKPLTNSTIAQ